jgi:hypothetical protein
MRFNCFYGQAVLITGFFYLIGYSKYYIEYNTPQYAYIQKNNPNLLELFGDVSVQWLEGIITIQLHSFPKLSEVSNLSNIRDLDQAKLIFIYTDNIVL